MICYFCESNIDKGLYVPLPSKYSILALVCKDCAGQITSNVHKAQEATA